LFRSWIASTLLCRCSRCSWLWAYFLMTLSTVSISRSLWRSAKMFPVIVICCGCNLEHNTSSANPNSRLIIHVTRPGTWQYILLYSRTNLVFIICRANLCTRTRIKRDWQHFWRLIQIPFYFKSCKFKVYWHIHSTVMLISGNVTSSRDVTKTRPARSHVVVCKGTQLFHVFLFCLLLLQDRIVVLSATTPDTIEVTTKPLCTVISKLIRRAEHLTNQLFYEILYQVVTDLSS
jgi:hypothetical protein